MSLLIKPTDLSWPLQTKIIVDNAKLKISGLVLIIFLEFILKCFSQINKARLKIIIGKTIWREKCTVSMMYGRRNTHRKIDAERDLIVFYFKTVVTEFPSWLRS